MLQSAIPLAAILLTSPALAFDTSKFGQGGSLPLSDLNPLLAKSPQLQREIYQALTDGKKAKDDVICDGMRFPGQWQKSRWTARRPLYLQLRKQMAEDQNQSAHYRAQRRCD
jgi:hypothetical protein